MGLLCRRRGRRDSNDLLRHRIHPVHPAPSLETKVTVRRRRGRRIFARLSRTRHFDTTTNVVDDTPEECWDAHRRDVGLSDVSRHSM